MPVAHLASCCWAFPPPSLIFTAPPHPTHTHITVSATPLAPAHVAACTPPLPSQAVDKVTPLNPEECVPFVGEALRRLRAEVRAPRHAGAPRRQPGSLAGSPIRQPQPQPQPLHHHPNPTPPPPTRCEPPPPHPHRPHTRAGRQ